MLTVKNQLKQISVLTTLLLLSFFAHGQVITDGLIGYWPFNGNANDESTNSNDGIVTGASLTTDRFGVPNAAYAFDGAGDYINLGNDPTLFPTSFSINLWFKYEQAQNSVLLGNINSLSGEWGTVLSLRDGTGPATAVASGANNHLIVHDSESPLPDNEWHMLTLVYDGENSSDQISTYIDGCFSGLNNLAGSSGGFNSSDRVQFDQDLSWYFGAASQYFFTSNNNGPQYFEGALDDGMLFNRPLSSIEIMQLFIGEVVITHGTIYDTMRINALNEMEGLVGHWPFNGNANDESISNNDGIVTGASLTTDRFGVPNAAYAFDGAGDYINLGNDSTLFPASFSINLWFKYEQAQNSVLLGNINSLSGEWGTVLSLRDGTGPATAVASGANNHLIVHDSESPLPDNEWHMLTLVYDGENSSDQISTYIDGCFSGLNNLAGSSGGFNSSDRVQFDQDLSWYFGAASQYFFTSNNNGPQYFEGALDDGMLFNRPLSSIEIMKLFIGEMARPENTLIGYYPLDNDYNDYSGYNYHGSPVGNSVFTETDQNGGIQLNGSTDWIEVAANGDMDVLQEFTVSAWFKLDTWTVPNLYVPIINKTEVSSGLWDNGFVLSVDVQQKKLFTNYGGSNTNGVVSGKLGTADLNLNQWYCVTFKNSVEGGLQIYLDGALDISEDYIGVITTPNEDLRIGKYVDENGLSQYFPGTIDEVKIYNYSIEEDCICCMKTTGCIMNCQEDSTIIYSTILTENQTFAASSNIVSRTIISQAATINLVAGDQIQLLPGFHAKKESTFRAYIDDCESTSTCIEEELYFLEQPSAKLDFDLQPSQIDLKLYPSPAYSNVTIEFSLLESEEISLYLYDLKGQRIIDIANNQLFHRGIHEIQLNSSNFQNGIYFIQLESKSQNLRQKIIFLD